MNNFSALIIVAAVACCAENSDGREMPAPGSLDAVRPYEIFWAKRTADEHAPPLVPFENVDGWTATSAGGTASICASQEQLVFGDWSAKLTYRASGGGDPTVTVRAPAPVHISPGIDTVSIWVRGNHDPWGPKKTVARTVVRLDFADAEGKDVSFDIAWINFDEWFLCRKKFDAGLAKRFEKGGVFNGFTVRGGTNTFDCALYFSSLCAYREELKPLSYKPRAKRGVQIFPAQDQGMNTGKGRLPFPNATTTVVPVEKPDPNLEFRYPSSDGSWDEIAFRYGGGEWIQLARGGGAKGADAKIKTRFRRIGNSLVADVEGTGAEELTFGAVGADGELVVMPYYTYTSHREEERPRVGVVKYGKRSLFVSATADWTQSSGSQLFAPRAGDEGLVLNGGSRYIPKLDGARNPLFERFVWTVSPEFAKVLPVIPNPVSSYRKLVAGNSFRSHSCSVRENDKRYWSDMKRRGYAHMTVIDHEWCFRDGFESYSFRVDAAPKKGGDEGQYDYARHMIDTLGYMYGPYNNFTDLAPINEYWSDDHALRRPDGSWQVSWNRCYAPKPCYAVEMCEKLTPVYQAKFNFNTAYCDVHTAVTPWDRTDYDARTPGAGTFAQSLYSSGEVMLIQKKCWKGPVFSEGGCHWMYSGLSDGNYACDGGYSFTTSPWLVDFDLLRIHPLTANVGMGDEGRFYHGKIPSGVWERADPFVAAIIAFGHSPILSFGPVEAYSYYMLQAICARIAAEDAKDIRYADANGRFLPTSEAVASGAYRRSQVAVKYADGSVVVVNGNHDGEPLAVTLKGRRVVLTPYGFIARSGKDVLSFCGTKGARRLSLAVGPEYAYVAARNREEVETPVGGTDGELARVFRADGREEVFCYSGTHVVLPYRARSVRALGRDGEDLGPVETGDGEKTRLAPKSGVFSWLVEPDPSWKGAGIDMILDDLLQ
jgi:hypothetical protein